MLVHAGQEADIVADAAVIAADGVGEDLFVSVSEMGVAVDVVDCGGKEKAFSHDG